MPSLPVLHSCLRELVLEVVEYDPPGTILNFLLTTGPHVLWVYSWPGRRPGSETWNGLHYVVKNHNSANASVVLSDDDYRLDVRPILSRDAGGVPIDGSSPSSDEAEHDDADGENNTNEEDNPYCIVATKPLTSDPDWVELQPGELILMDNGLPHVSVRELFRVELQGHGLNHQGRARIKPPRLEEDLRRFESQPDFFAAGGI
jgi:Glutamine amidotransferases class-II